MENDNLRTSIIMAYQFKYLEVKRKPWNMGICVERKDVSHLNKKGIDQVWDQMDEKYSKEEFQSGLTKTNTEMLTIEDNEVVQK